MKSPSPPDDAARLAALKEYEILDTLGEEAFDDITRLAAFICDTPIALISLVDRERQWFKARFGLQRTETPREDAFCAHAILAPSEVMIVRDASVDPRFADNPLVKSDPRIRFYAGAPLLTPSGQAIGTLCVIDRAPRRLSAERVDALRALARQVVAQLELRRVISELERLAQVQRAYQRQLEDDKSRIQVQNAELEAESLTDGLTRIGNRRAFDQRLFEESERANRERIPLSLLLIDIDKFKPFNDDFGHVAGDAALSQVAQILQANARPSDLVTRYGGEEFAVILPNTRLDGAISTGERLRRAIEATEWSDRAITVSVGAATAHERIDREALVSQADEALYAVKQRGGNQVLHAIRSG